MAGLFKWKAGSSGSSIHLLRKVKILKSENSGILKNYVCSNHDEVID